MKKLLVFLFLFSGIATLCPAQPRIAVLEFKAGAGISQSEVDGLSGIFSTYLIDTRQFQVVERVQINRLIAEQNLQLSSLTENQTVEIGRLLNVRYVVVGDVNLVMGQYTIVVRLLDVQTATGLASAAGQWKTSDNYLEVMKKLVSELVGKIATKPTADKSSAAPSPVITLLGYLHVYPEDLGNFQKLPVRAITNINDQAMYGYDNWRLPTEEELQILQNNADRLQFSQPETYKTMETPSYPHTRIRLIATDDKPSIKNISITSLYIDPGVISEILQETSDYSIKRTLLQIEVDSLRERGSIWGNSIDQTIKDFYSHQSQMSDAERAAIEKQLSEERNRFDQWFNKAQSEVSAKHDELLFSLFQESLASLKNLITEGNCALLDANFTAVMPESFRERPEEFLSRIVLPAIKQVAAKNNYRHVLDKDLLKNLELSGENMPDISAAVLAEVKANLESN